MDGWKLRIKGGNQLTQADLKNGRQELCVCVTNQCL